MIALVALAAPALADSPHFINASASVDNAGNLVCTFKEAGLGTTVSTEAVTCSADATAVYACINGGGNHPKAANKETSNAVVNGGTDVQAKNGHASGSITAGPPASTLVCPSGQTFVLACASYTDIVVTDTTNDVAASLPDVSRTFFDVGAPCS